MAADSLLFLDFDGVLHPDPCEIDAWFRDSELLASILALHPAWRIVVHSSWRLTEPELQIRDCLGPLITRYAGTTDCAIQQRWDSISAFLKSRSDVNDYVIVDDFELTGEHSIDFCDHFVLVDGTVGLSGDSAAQERLRSLLRGR